MSCAMHHHAIADTKSPPWTRQLGKINTGQGLNAIREYKCLDPVLFCVRRASRMVTRRRWQDGHPAWRPVFGDGQLTR
jgi:hypothetical protein